MSVKGVKPDWPALMKPPTARAYLDDMPADKFTALVVPHLDTRTTGGTLRFTRKSLDDWIDASGGAREAHTPEALGRLLDDDDGPHLRHQALRQ